MASPNRRRSPANQSQRNRSRSRSRGKSKSRSGGCTSTNLLCHERLNRSNNTGSGYNNNLNSMVLKEFPHSFYLLRKKLKTKPRTALGRKNALALHHGNANSFLRLLTKNNLNYIHRQLKHKHVVEHKPLKKAEYKTSMNRVANELRRRKS